MNNFLVRIANENNFEIMLEHADLLTASAMYRQRTEFGGTDSADELIVDFTNDEMILFESIIKKNNINYSNINIISLTNILNYMHIHNEYILKKIILDGDKCALDWLENEINPNENFFTSKLICDIIDYNPGYYVDVKNIHKDYLESNNERIHKFIAKNLDYYLISEFFKISDNNFSKKSYNETLVNKIVELAQLSKNTENPIKTFVQKLHIFFSDFMEKIKSGENMDDYDQKYIEYARNNINAMDNVCNALVDTDKAIYILNILLGYFGYSLDIEIISNKSNVVKLFVEIRNKLQNIISGQIATHTENIVLDDDTKQKLEKYMLENSNLKEFAINYYERITNACAKQNILKYSAYIHTFLDNTDIKKSISNIINNPENDFNIEINNKLSISRKNIDIECTDIVDVTAQIKKIHLNIKSSKPHIMIINFVPYGKTAELLTHFACVFDCITKQDIVYRNFHKFIFMNDDGIFCHNYLFVRVPPNLNGTNVEITCCDDNLINEKILIQDVYECY